MAKDRGAAIWGEARATALPEIAVPVAAVATVATGAAAAVVTTDANADMLTARVTALETALQVALDRIAGLEAAAGLFQRRQGDEPARASDGGVAEMMDQGWIKADDSDLTAQLV